MKRLITALSSLGLLTLTCTVLAFPPSNAGLARSTVQVKAPNNPVDVNGCLACHQTVNSLMMNTAVQNNPILKFRSRNHRPSR